MKRYIVPLAIFLTVLASMANSVPAQAANEYCFYSSNLNQATPQDFQAAGALDTGCEFPVPANSCTIPNIQPLNPQVKYLQVQSVADQAICNSQSADWRIQYAQKAQAAQAANATGFCFCASDLSKAGPADDLNATNAWGSVPCFPATQDLCSAQTAPVGNLQHVQCSFTTTQNDCAAKELAWQTDLKNKNTGAANLANQKSNFTFSGSIIPACLLQDVIPPECRDVSIFVVLLINLGQFIFGIIGALALAAFVYGGFMLILSSGNPEKIKKGTDAMLAAVIGLGVSFGAYVIISFLGKAINIR